MGIIFNSDNMLGYSLQLLEENERKRMLSADDKRLWPDVVLETTLDAEVVEERLATKFNPILGLNNMI